MYGVKVLGRKSPNTPYQDGRPMRGVTEGTEYTPAAFKSAVRAVEGAKVRLNHPDRKTPNAERPVEDGFGVLRNVRATPDGLRADLHYNRKHPFAEQLIEDVERRMGQWGFSPNALGIGDVRNGVYVVEEIASIRSVDLVSDPATTVNLWESRQESTMSLCFRDLLESVLPKVRGKKRVTLVNFLEADFMAPPEEKEEGAAADVMDEDDPAAMGIGDTPVDMPPEAMPSEGGDPDEALSAGFTAAAKACIDACMTGGMDANEAIKKLKELLTTHSKLTAAAAEPVPAIAETEEGEDEDAKDKKDDEKADVKESRSLAAKEWRELETYRNRSKVASVCESLNFKPTDAQLNGLAQMTESDVRAFVLDTIKQTRGPKSFGVPREDAPAKATGTTGRATMPADEYKANMARLGREIEVD